MTPIRLRTAALYGRKTLFPALFLLLALIASPLHAQLSASAQKQIEEIYAFKRSFTPAEKKLSTNLVLLSRLAQHKPLGALARFVSPLAHDANGNAEVEVVGFMTPSLMSSETMRFVEKVNGVVPAGAFRSGHVRTHVSESQLLELAGHPDVKSVGEVTGAHTNVGSVTSQGYITHGANKVVAAGINGSGVKVGVLSDSASPTRVAALIASGDLPADTVVLTGAAGSGEDEGTAMMEIVHDMAPGAKLFFATAFNGESDFANNIRLLRFTYHCDIIVDDISYFDEPVFQDGIVAAAVNDITADGGLYFSAAANSGNLSSGTSGTWEGDFNPGPASALIVGYEGAATPLHNFGTLAAPQTYDVLTTSPASGVYLQWSDAQGASANDYDLFILNSTGTTVKGFGANAQTGTQNPFEFVQPSSTCTSAKPTGYCPAAGDRVVVTLYSGVTRAIHIDTERATLSIGTAGATFGHNAAANTFTLAAVYWNSSKQGIRPFTGGAANPIETFSSDGTRKIFYKPDGTPITPNNFLFATNGGTTLQKPDAAAADGVTTRTPGFNPFFGTSAAAPHAAAIAALVKSAAPTLTNVQIRGILTSTTFDDMAPGVDRDSGYGILIAPNAVQAAQALASSSATQ